MHLKNYGWYVPFSIDGFGFQDHNQDGDEASIFDSAQALVTLQKLFGPFPRVLGKGNFAFVSFGVCGGLLPTSPPPLSAALAITGQGVYSPSCE